MYTKTRLASGEFIEHRNISVRHSKNFIGSTLHGHDFYELELISAGAAQTKLNGKLYQACKGSVFFMTPADFHEYTDTDNAELYNIQFTAEAVSSEMLERLVSNKKRIYNPTSVCFGEIIQIISVMNEINEQKGEYTEIQTRLLETVLLLLSRENGTEAHHSSDENKNIQKALMYIHEHFRENPTLATVASTLPLNKHYFCTKFREYTGKTYKEYLKLLKLRYARRLILATNLSILEVAENSGYSTQSHFNKEFREHYGISPLRMRKNTE